MKLSRRNFMGAIATGSTGLIAPGAFAAVRSGDRPALLDRAMDALNSHGSKIRDRKIVGLVDFSMSSGMRRFQIVDIGNGEVLANHLVAHGRGSDPANSGWARRFSNRPGSNASSQGSFLIGETYFGKHGRSLRLHGLDPENDLAFSRTIVIHGANYVSDGIARTSGRVGRSLGCFTVSQRDVAQVLAKLGPGKLLFAAK